MEWWNEARFGMFIHWGLYSEAGGYWDGKPGDKVMNLIRVSLVPEG